MDLPTPVSNYIKPQLAVDCLCHMDANRTCKYPAKMNYSYLDNIQ